MKRNREITSFFKKLTLFFTMIGLGLILLNDIVLNSFIYDIDEFLRTESGELGELLLEKNIMVLRVEKYLCGLLLILSVVLQRILIKSLGNITKTMYPVLIRTLLLLIGFFSLQKLVVIKLCLENNMEYETLSSFLSVGLVFSYFALYCFIDKEQLKLVPSNYTNTKHESFFLGNGFFVKQLIIQSLSIICLFQQVFELCIKYIIPPRVYPFLDYNEPRQFFFIVTTSFIAILFLMSSKKIANLISRQKVISTTKLSVDILLYLFLFYIVLFILPNSFRLTGYGLKTVFFILLAPILMSLGRLEMPYLKKYDETNNDKTFLKISLIILSIVSIVSILFDNYIFPMYEVYKFKNLYVLIVVTVNLFVLKYNNPISSRLSKITNKLLL